MTPAAAIALSHAAQAVHAIHTATHVAVPNPIPDNRSACRYSYAAPPAFVKPLLVVAAGARDRAYRAYAEALVGGDNE